LMMELPVEITPSIFGYSMIYPYSDNFLDDQAVTGEEKKQYSHRFNRRLHGEKINPHNHTEMQLFRLVEMFEEQYSRIEFPEVYESLYAIQQGQTNSLKLMKIKGIPDAEIRKICFEKGGASVLADGYLVAGKLSQEQERALFGYGVYLQLLDDIQDVHEDSEANTHTLFSCTGRFNLDDYVNRTVNFGRMAMEDLRCFNVEPNSFLQLMNQSIETMIIESVGLNPLHFSEEWLKKMEQHSPLRFEFIRTKRSQSKSQRFGLFQKYFSQQQSEAVGF
ncbi:MAG: class 1 isoprenoid biosynthesis enzyme, partial [Prolixibacteraceae bacterium]